MPKKLTIDVSDDQVRQKILEFLYLMRKKARSLSSVAVSISEIKKGLKGAGIGQSQVVTNLDYLIQHEWVIEEIEKRVFKSPKGFDLPSEKRSYKLSPLGINHFEGTSKFSNISRFSGINIHNINGITIVGNNNVVREAFVDIYRKLDQLETSMKLSGSISEEQKLSSQVDIQAIKDQLTKPLPDKTIIKQAMDGISFLGSIPGVKELFDMVRTAIGSLFGG